MFKSISFGLTVERNKFVILLVTQAALGSLEGTGGIKQTRQITIVSYLKKLTQQDKINKDVLKSFACYTALGTEGIKQTRRKTNGLTLKKLAQQEEIIF